MKPSLRLLAFALGTGLAFAAPTAAQAQVSVGINLGGLPPWGPPVQQGTQYYYIPEIDGYYDIYNGSYIVFDGQQWLSVPYLDGYDPYYFHPVPVAYVGAQPWLNIGTYRRRYPQYVTVYRGGGYGNAGRYYGHDYGAGRVYGYDRGGYTNRPGYSNGGGNYSGNRGGYDRRDDNDRRGGYPDNRGGNYGGRDQRGNTLPQGGGQPGNRGGQPNFGQGQGPQPGGQNQGQLGGPGRGGQGQPGGDRGQGGGPGRGGDRGLGRR